MKAKLVLVIDEPSKPIRRIEVVSISLNDGILDNNVLEVARTMFQVGMAAGAKEHSPAKPCVCGDEECGICNPNSHVE